MNGENGREAVSRWASLFRSLIAGGKAGTRWTGTQPQKCPGKSLDSLDSFAMGFVAPLWTTVFD